LHNPRSGATFVGTEASPMADLEVINHLKKATDNLHNPKLSPWHKIKELGREIFIIVFAVSLSIWLHEWSEERHEQSEARHFLAELRQDLKYDLEEYENDRRDYVTKAQVFGEISVPDPVPAAVERLYDVIHDFDEPMPSLGRYESFKFSGKIGYIHQPGLAGNIIRLFEEDVRRLQHLTGDYIRLQNEFHDRMNEQLVYSSETESNIREIAGKGIFRNLARDLRHTEDIQQGYTNCINRIESILPLIDKVIGPEKK